MKIKKNDLLSLIDQNDPQLIKIFNFYHTFGYLVIENGIDENGINLLRRRVIEMAKPYLDKDANGSYVANRSYVFHRALEGDHAIIEFFIKSRYLDFVKTLLGKNAAFFNSDANIFTTAATWHRDLSTLMPTVKVMAYLQDSDSESSSGDFGVIPGSHLVQDAYSSFLNANSSWPDGSPFHINYPSPHIDNSMIPTDKRMYDGSQFPFHTISIKQSDLFLFDARIFHTTYVHTKPMVRLNFTALFIGNPIDIHPSSFLRNYASEDEFNNDLDHFFNTISRSEDCRTHQNMDLPEIFPELQQHLYFKKFGLCNESSGEFNSYQAQKNSTEPFLKHFIKKNNLRLF